MILIPGLPGEKVYLEDGYSLVFSGDKLMVRIEEDKIQIPRYYEFSETLLNKDMSFYLGEIDGIKTGVYPARVTYGLPSDLEFVSLFEIFQRIDESTRRTIGRAFHLLNWHMNTRYCGKCGKLNEFSSTELSKECPDCGLITYPQIAPAIIVAVTRGDEILLAYSKRFRRKIFSTLAGFAEPGENLEECVKREVHEEVGIKVKNIKYFGSDPWPFPNSLMVGFTAEYESGELKLQEEEITEAGWFTKDNLPPGPSTISIAGRLIKNFVETH